MVTLMSPDKTPTLKIVLPNKVSIIKFGSRQEEYDKIQGLLDARLIQMYEAPKLQFLQVMLESTSVTDFLSTYYAMKDLAECDKES